LTIMDDNELEKLREEREKEKRLQASIVDITEQSKVFERIVRQLVKEYCEAMDDFSEELDRIIKDVKRGRIKKYSELKLEMKCLELANAMYKATDGLAVMGSRTDVAKAQKQEMFNQAYLKVKDGTIPEKTAEANNAILEELLVEKIMDRAYSVISQKVKSANRVLEAIKKVLTSRMIHQEVFRKEAPVMDRIHPDELTEGDDQDEFGLGDDI
jgi:hypothetical protein